MVELIVVFALVTLAVARLVRLVVADKMCGPLRGWVVGWNGPQGWISYLVHCPHCMAVWVSAAAVPAAWFLTHSADLLQVTSWFALPVTILAVAYLAGLVVAKEAR